MIGMVKFGLLALPLISQRLQGGASIPKKNINKVSGSVNWRVHWASRDDALKTLRLPKSLSRASLEALVTDIQNELADQAEKIETKRVQHSYIIDFSQVRSMALSANEAFCELNRLFASGQAKGFLVGLSKSFKKRLARGRVMDLATSNSFSTAQMQNSLMARNSQQQLKTYMVGKTCLNYFSGEITGENFTKMGFENSIHDVADERGRHIVLHVVGQLDATVAERHCGELDGVGDDGANLERIALDLELAGLDLGEVEDVVNDR